MKYVWMSMALISFCPLVSVLVAPGPMGVFTLFMALGSCLSVGFIYSSWYGLSMWLVYVSGLMVLFLFFCSMSPNPEFKFSGWGLGVGMVVFFLQLITEVYSDSPILGYGCIPQPLILYQGSSGFMLVWMGAYLFFSMVVVSKVASKHGGCLRRGSV